MNEELEMVYMELNDSIEKAIVHFRAELAKIRAGKASPQMLASVMVEAYGTMSPLNAVANISTPDSRTLTVQPFDRGVISDIERAIINSNLGFNPMNDGMLIRISIPPLTEERRKELVKLAKVELENAKISFRNARRDAIEAIKKLVKDGLSEDIGKDAEAEVQDMINNNTKVAETIFDEKEKDILTV